MKYYKTALSGILLLGLVFPVVAYAYLDPGTGSYILGIIIALFAGVAVAFRVVLRKIIIFLGSIFSKAAQTKKKDDWINGNA